MHKCIHMPARAYAMSSACRVHRRMSQVYAALRLAGYYVHTDSSRDVVGRHALHAAVLNDHVAFAKQLLHEVSTYVATGVHSCDRYFVV